MLGTKDTDFLQATLESILRQVKEKCRICVFVDGLDEFSGDQDVLIKLIGDVQTADVKVCLSSRPYRSYIDAFGSSAKLRLQDLTESDIKRYVSAKLYRLVEIERRQDSYRIFDTILWKAEGVFLWVELVVKQLIKGLQNDDTLEQLQERLELMPSDIEDLYAHMLTKIDKVYRTQAAKLFRIKLLDLSIESGSIDNLFGLALFGRSNEISDTRLTDAVSYCEGVSKRLPTICAGLLEVHKRSRVKGGKWMSADPSLSLTIPYTQDSPLAKVESCSNTKVDFIHRSARDFLVHSRRGKAFMVTYCPESFNPHIAVLDMLVTETALLGFATANADGRGYYYSGYDYANQDYRTSIKIHDLMKLIFEAEWQTDSVQLSLFESLDRTLTAVYQRHGLPSPKALREIMETTSVAERQNDTAPISSRAEYEIILADMNRSSSPKAHWSVRWGIYIEKRLVLGAEIDSPSLRSRTNSEGPFRSADIGPRVCENSREMPTKPVDFVGFAASWGLSYYVEHSLSCESKTVDQDYADYLLCCSIGAFQCQVDFTTVRDNDKKFIRACDLVVKVLRLGADCNIYVKDFSNTLWGVFLTQLIYILDHTNSRIDVSRACVMAMNAFLENGADKQVKTYREIYVRLEGPNYYKGLTCLEENSALYAVQENLNDVPDFETLKNKFLKNGGCVSSRWTHIGFRDWYSVKWDEHPLYEISEQQTHKLRAALRACGINDAGKKVSRQIWQKCVLDVGRLYKESRRDNEILGRGGSSNQEVWPTFDEEETFDTEVHSATDVEEVYQAGASLLARYGQSTARWEPYVVV